MSMPINAIFPAARCAEQQGWKDTEGSPVCTGRVTQAPDVRRSIFMVVRGGLGTRRRGHSKAAMVVVADREREIESCAPSSGELIVEPDFLAKGDWKMSASSCRELIGRKLIARCQSAMRAAIIF
jgi:hypothetical protein